MSAPYRPANGTEGAIFEMHFCDQCVRDKAFRDSCRNGGGSDEDGCPILAAAYRCNVDETGFPKEWIEDEQGPRCTAFEEVDQ